MYSSIAEQNTYSYSAMNVTLVVAEQLSSQRWTEILAGVWLVLVIVIGTPLNLVVIVVFAKSRHLITPFSILMITLFILDLTMCSLMAVLPMIAEFSGGWLYLMDFNLCILEASSVYFIGLSSMFVLAGIAISRQMVVRRLTSSDNWTRAHSFITIAVSVGLAAVFTVAPLLGFGSYGLEIHQTSCGLSWQDSSQSQGNYIIIIAIFCYALPFLIMTACYLSIHRMIRMSVDVAPQIQWYSQQRQRRLVKLSLVIIGAFFVAWTPYAVVSFYQAFGRPDNINPLLTKSCSLLAKSEAVFNPLLFIVTMKDIRERVISIVPGLASLCHRPGNDVRTNTIQLNARTTNLTRTEGLTMMGQSTGIL